MSDYLKLCPFCGGTPEWVNLAHPSGIPALRCSECQFSMQQDRRDKTIFFWNRRTTPGESTMAEGHQQGEGVKQEQQMILLLEKYLREGGKTVLQTMIVNEHLMIQFLNKIDSASMSDKSWLGEQKNLRVEAERLRERLAGKGNGEIKINLKNNKT